MARFTTPTVKDPELRFALQQIYNALNQLDDSLKNVGVSVSKTADNKYVVELNGPEVSLTTGDSTFTAKTK